MQSVAVSQAREHAEGQVFHPAVVNQSAHVDKCFSLRFWVSRLSSPKSVPGAKQTLCLDMMKVLLELHSTLAGSSSDVGWEIVWGKNPKALSAFHVLPAGLCRRVTEVGGKSGGGKPEENTEDTR